MARSEDFGEADVTRAKHANPLVMPGAASDVELVRLHVVVERVGGVDSVVIHTRTPASFNAAQAKFVVTGMSGAAVQSISGP